LIKRRLGEHRLTVGDQRFLEGEPVKLPRPQRDQARDAEHRAYQQTIGPAPRGGG
jgi:hypothetical protein